MTKAKLRTFSPADTMAPLPYPLQRNTVFDGFRPYGIIVRIMLAEYRQIWFMNVFMGFLLPFGFIFL